MVFSICGDATCPKACWCKRFTYKNKLAPDMLGTGGYPYVISSACMNTGYTMYHKNKAREIYERDYPDGSRDDESEQEEHENNNRESGMREDDEADQGTPRSIPPDDVAARVESLMQDCVLQLQCSGDRRSYIESFVRAYDDFCRDIKQGRS